jgi:hypothetical protein
MIDTMDTSLGSISVSLASETSSYHISIKHDLNFLANSVLDFVTPQSIIVL